MIKKILNFRNLIAAAIIGCSAPASMGADTYQLTQLINTNFHSLPLSVASAATLTMTNPPAMPLRGETPVLSVNMAVSAANITNATFTFQTSIDGTDWATLVGSGQSNLVVTVGGSAASSVANVSLGSILPAEARWVRLKSITHGNVGATFYVTNALLGYYY